MVAPAVDVIIAARDEGKWVGACIDALRRQDCDGPLRICVVDNASTDDTASVAAAHGAEVLRAPRRGRGAARNSALRATHATLVAFLDAHIIVEPDWMRLMVERFDDPRIGGCQSRIDHHAVDRRVQRYLQRSAARRAEHLAADSIRGERNLFPWVSTAGCIYRRAALDSAGAFNEHLVACEDVELSWRVVARGYRLGYVADAAAAHYEGRPWWRFVSKGFAYGRGAAQIESLYRLQGARTTFGRLPVRHREAEEVLESLSYRLGFCMQKLAERFGVASRLEPIAACTVDAAFRPWFTWSAATRLRISPRAIFWLYDDGPGSVVVQPSERRRYVLDGTADFVWRVLVREGNRDQIAGRVAAVYDVPLATAASDVDELIEQLVGDGLVERERELKEGRARQR